MLTFLKDQEDAMFALLEEIVNIDSGTYIEGGTDRVGEVLRKAYEEEGFHVKTHTGGEYGVHLQIRASKDAMPHLLIVGHMDTVFPEGTAKKRPFRRDETYAYGPGVSDMKASLVAVLFALKALKEIGDSSYKKVEVIMNSDEEIGSPTSRQLIEESARRNKYAIVVEPSRGEKDSIVTARKSASRYFMTITGRAAHAGSRPEDGISAIEEAAYKIIEIEKLNDLKAGISVNVGLIDGGTAANAIPEQCQLAIDVRTNTMKQAEQIRDQIETIHSTVYVEGTKSTLTGGITHPPMEKDQGVKKLLKIVQEAGEEVGVKILDTHTGGGSDGCFTAPIIPTIDGMGPAGGGAHSNREYLKVDTFFERTLVLAKTIQKLNTTL